MTDSTSQVNTRVPGARRRERRAVRFPTATVDFRPAVARLDSALAWLARSRAIGNLSTPLARWSRRGVFHIHRIDTQAFTPPAGDPYDMLQLWVSNASLEDADSVRCQTRWTTDSPLLNIKTELGLWLRISPFEQTQRLAGIAGEVDLPARSGMGRNGMQYLGLAAKYHDDEHAYIVTADSYQQFVEGGLWRHPSAALPPGVHHVDIAFQTSGGKAALIRLNVLNLGRGGPVTADLSIGQLTT